MTLSMTSPIHPTKGYTLDLTCPVITCEACQKVIDASHPGAAVWSPEQTRPQVLFVHKGTCHRWADKQFEARYGRSPHWNEIAAYLAQLVLNYSEPVTDGREVTMPSSGDVFKPTDWTVA